MKNKRQILDVLIVLSSTKNQYEKYPLGNTELTRQVKDFEKRKWIKYDEFFDEWNLM